MLKELRSRIWVQPWNQPAVIALLIFAIIVRLACVPNRSGDYIGPLSEWSDFIVANGGWAALKSNFANYTPPYLYWLVIAVTTLSWMPHLLALKLLAMAADFLAAYIVYRIVKLKFPTGSRALATFFAVLFTPTIPINSALWGQCDVLYTTGLLASLYYLCVGRKNLALIAFGVGFALKLQSIFLALFFLALLLRGYVKIWQFVFVPIVYFVLAIPNWMIGRPLLDLFLIYGQQVGDNRELTKNAPNIYQWFADADYSIFMPLGVLVTFLIIVGLSWMIYQRKVKIEPNFLVTLFVASVLLIPFFLPRMHDRYFYPADIGTLLFVAYFPQGNYIWMPIVLQIASIMSYINGDLTPLLKYCGVGIGVVIYFVLRHLYQQFLAPNAQSLTPQLEP